MEAEMPAGHREPCGVTRHEDGSWGSEWQLSSGAWSLVLNATPMHMWSAPIGLRALVTGLNALGGSWK